MSAPTTTNSSHANHNMVLLLEQARAVLVGLHHVSRRKVVVYTERGGGQVPGVQGGALKG